ncbi:MAG: DUF5335 family protein [Gammaproteobacteria bacterium]
MANREIPRGQWTAFFESFSLQHEGWIVRVEVQQGPDSQLLVRALPLVGIAVDWKGSEAGSFLITLGITPEGHWRHRIVAPARVRLKETQAGAVEAVEIAATGGETTLVQFRSAVLPETVDGILE